MTTITIPIHKGAVPASAFDRQTAAVDVSGVPAILEAVRTRGDAAVAEFNRQFDGDALEPFEVVGGALESLVEQVPGEVRAALELAQERIAAFAATQRKAVVDSQWERDGVRAGTKFIAVERVACYVPGGRYPLPSSALMTVTAARAAGVREVIVLSPRIAPATALAAVLAGADRIFRIGGAQGVAAAACGTGCVPRVDMVVGPGNAYVTEAKRLLIGRIGIDMLAGPSEVVVIADHSANADRLAADLLAQAEHDPAAMALLLTPDADLAERVQERVAELVPALSLPDYIGESLGRGGVVVMPDMEACIVAANDLAPEHLELHVTDPHTIAVRVSRYGCLFIGEHSAEVFGDYLAGTNHVLPTGGSARFSAGLSPLTFLQPRQWLEMSAGAAAALSAPCRTLAQAEGLAAHAEAARLRGE